MAKESWDKLQSRFLKAHAETGITPKAWCESQGLNYTSARRYIKKSPGTITPKKSAQKSAQKSAKSAQKPAQRIISEALKDDGESTLSIDPEEFGITLQQAWFAHWFIITKSRVEAYRLAGYEGKGNTAYVGASRLYRNDKIRCAIRYLQDKDRINAVNSMLCNTYGERRLLVNTVKCPKFTKGLERQIYDKNGEPEKDKGGKKSKKMFDHGNDAGGYPIAHLFPVKQRIYDLNMDTTF